MKTFKKLLALGLSAITAASVAVFAGCKGGHTDNDDKQSVADSSDPSAQPSDPSDNPVNPPVEGDEAGEAEKAEQLANAVAELKKFLKTAAESQNFTYADKAPQTDLKLEFEGQKLKKTEKGTVTFYESTATGETFCYTGNGDGWDKDFSDFDIPGRMDSVKNMANSISWTEFDQSGNLIGKISNGNTNAKVTAQLSQNAAKIVIKAEVTEQVLEDLTIEKVGGTTVTIPNEKITDKTVDASDLLYTEVNGERIWNVKLIADTIENWMPKDYFNQLDGDLTKVKVINVEYRNDKLYIDTYLIGNEQSCFQRFKTRTQFAEMLTDRQMKNKEQFENYLKHADYNTPLIIDEARTLLDYAIGIDANEDEKNEFAVLSQNIVDRLVSVGVQPSNISNEGMKQVELNNGNVVFGCMGPVKNSVAGFGLGNFALFDVVLVVKVDNDLKLVKANICSSTDRVENGKTNVLNNNQNNWLVQKCEIEDMSKENAVLYENA